jgi:glycogen phosphorylase
MLAYLGAFPVAYFSAEFGIHESIGIYSGGLGVLSGDHIKSASGLGVPLVGIGLFYSQGYFKQKLNHDGWQDEEYINNRVENLPIEPALAADGSRSPCHRHADGPSVGQGLADACGAGQAVLLDCDVEGNQPEDRKLTSRLYGGDCARASARSWYWAWAGSKRCGCWGFRPGCTI